MRSWSGFRLRSLLRSPLTVVGVVALGVTASSWAYGPEDGGGVARAEDGPHEVHRTSAASARKTATSLATDRALPRLLHAPDPDKPFGLPVAIEKGGGHPLAHFHEALERAAAGEGQAHIVFYGASHVASDTFTGPLRVALQKRYGDAGHGFVLPVHPWRSYRHLGVEIESNDRDWKTLRIKASSSKEDLDYYGLAGVAVESDVRGAYGEVRTSDRWSVGRKVGVFEVWYFKQPGGGDFDVLIDGKRVERIHTASRKPEAGYATYHVPDGPHALRVVVRGNGKVRIFGVSMERERPGVVLDTVGINGARSRYQLLWNDELYREHLARRHPDLVVLAYGTNESGDDRPIADYERDLREVVARVRDTVPDASCLLIGPSDRPVQVDPDIFQDRPRTEKIIAVQRRVAFHYGCGFFDLVAFEGGPLSMVEWAAADPPYARSDHIHFTIRGYDRLGDVMYQALLEGMPAGDGAAGSKLAAH